MIDITYKPRRIENPRSPRPKKGSLPSEKFADAKKKKPRYSDDNRNHYFVRCEPKLTPNNNTIKL
jgi:hypothetical protein